MKQRWILFADKYLECFNATEAARFAGYANPGRAGDRMSKNVVIQDYLSERFREKHLSPDEALFLLSDIAHGDLGEFMDLSPMGFSLRLVDENGKPKNTRLIKKIKQRTTIFLAKKESDEDREVHELEIELHDPLAAIDKILRVAGKYRDNLDINLVWRSEVIELIKTGKVSQEDLYSELGNDLATELFNSSGVPVVTSREN